MTAKMPLWYGARGRETADGPLDGGVRNRSWCDADDVPARDAAQTSRRRGAWASQGRRRVSEGVRASGGTAARMPRATGAGARCRGAERD
jgi:hypothetical protein